MGSRLDTTSPAVTVKEAMEEYEVRESKDRGQQHLSQDQQEGEEPRSNAEDHQHHHHLGHDHQHSSQDQHEGTGEQHHHHLSADHDGREAVRSACNNRMPGPIVQASQGGTSPRTLTNLQVSNMPHSTQDQHLHKEQSLEDQAVWIEGSKEVDMMLG